MSEPEDFEQHRRYLWSIAYRMLGSAAEAEDIVQEAYLRVRGLDQQALRSERAYLSQVVTRLCLDHWKSARSKRESYVGPWLPEPVRTEQPVDPASISLAFLVLLESLSPLERAIYLLSEVFDYSHAEIARIVQREEEACRKLLQRARERVLAQRPRFEVTREQHRRLLTTFWDACRVGDLAGLERLLSDDVVGYSDGGGKVFAARRPVVGPRLVGKLYTKLARLAPRSLQVEIADINGLPAVLLRLDGVVRSIIDIETDGERIVSVRSVVNPDKLAALIGS